MEAGRGLAVFTSSNDLWLVDAIARQAAGSSELAEVVIVKDGGCVEFNIDSIRDGDTGGRQMPPSVVNQRPVDRLRRITGRTTGVFQRCKPLGYRYLDNCYSFCEWHQIEDESFELEGVG